MLPEPTPEGGGSGCAPGGGQLPDGVWYGFVVDFQQSSVEFDLACFRSCATGTGFEVTNSNPAQRTVPVAPGATSIYSMHEAPPWVEPFVDFQAGFQVNPEGDGTIQIPAWIYINNGELTHIVWFPEPPRCRSLAFEVEWLADLPRAGLVAFNELGLASTAPPAGNGALFYWRDTQWTEVDELEGDAHSGWEGSIVAGDESMFAIGSTINEWTGSLWSTTSFDYLGDTRALSASGDRVLMATTTDEMSLVHVLTRSNGGWDIAEIPIAPQDEWWTMAGAIDGDTFAISDTGIDSGLGSGTVLVFEWDGARWRKTATLIDRWETGNWGSALDLQQDRLVVAADGATPGPGTPGGVYLYTRSGGEWKAEVVRKDSEGFGFGTRMDGDVIITSAARSDSQATFWLFSKVDDSWEGTSILVDGDVDAWLDSLDIRGSLIAVSTSDGVQIGQIEPIP